MKRFLSILSHPIVYFKVRKDQEQMLMLCFACSLLGIDKPDVWCVDKILDTINKTLLAFHLDRTLLDGNELVKSHLFWTRLISRFKIMKFTRDEVKGILDKYNFAARISSKENPSVDDVAAIYFCMASKFHLFM